MNRIGIFGGTFNPPHLGHMIAAEHVAHELRLDKVLFIPSYISPHKRTGEERSARQRLEMVRLAVEGHPSFEVCDIEVERKGASYTIDTIQELRSIYPADEFVLIIGADNLREFVSWKSYGTISELVTVVAMTRPGYKIDNGVPSPAGMISMEVPSIQISSSEIRRRIAENRDVRYLLQLSVLDYIRSNNLYRSSQT